MPTENEATSEALALFNEMGSVAKAPHLMKLHFPAAALQRARELQHKPSRQIAVGIAKSLQVMREFELRRRAALAVAPNVLIPLCFDQLAVNVASAPQVISTPYQGKFWTITDFLCDGTQGMLTASATAATTTIYSGGFRLTSFKVAGIDFIANTTTGTGGGAAGVTAPTSPGVPLVLWSHNRIRTPENTFRPWAGLALRPEAQVTITVYHEGTAATPAASLYLTCMVRSTPCDSWANDQMVSRSKQASIMAAIGAHRISH